MQGRRCAGVVIERSHPQENALFAGSFGDKMRPASRTKAAQLSR
jgi:hypothetical protein